MLSLIDKIGAKVNYVVDKSGILISLLFFPGWLLVLYSVIARYFFNNPSSWAGDYSKYIFAIYFVLGGAYCLLHKSHIRVDVIYNMFNRKKQVLVELFIVFPMLFAFIFPFIWQGSMFAWDAYRFMEVAPPPTPIPLYPIKAAIPIAGILFLLQASFDLYRFCFNRDREEEGVNER